MKSPGKINIRLQPLNIAMLIIALTLSVVILIALNDTRSSYNDMQAAFDKYLICQESANSLQAGSDYLTLQVRDYTVTGDPDSLTNYFNEARHTRRRDKALETMGEYFDGTAAYAALENALKRSNELMYTEYEAMRLVVDARGYDLSSLPREILETELTEAEKALSSEEKINLARELVFGEAYQEKKLGIENDVSECLESMLSDMSVESERDSRRLSNSITRQMVLVSLLTIIVLAIMLLISRLIIRPLRNSVSYIMENQKIPETGSYEMQYLASTYNHIFEKTKSYQDQLSFEASHDALTGLFNRGIFDDMKEVMGNEDAAMILIDLDKFKILNDTYGHETGDKALKRLAEVLKRAFRSEDYVCRIGGDEFAVIMVNATDKMKGLISSKAERIMDSVRDTKDGVPGFTLSIGVAFSDGKTDGDQIYKNADEALYKVKNGGKNGLAFFGDNQ